MFYHLVPVWKKEKRIDKVVRSLFELENYDLKEIKPHPVFADIGPFIYLENGDNIMRLSFVLYDRFRQDYEYSGKNNKKIDGLIGAIDDKIQQYYKEI